MKFEELMKEKREKLGDQIAEVMFLEGVSDVELGKRIKKRGGEIRRILKGDVNVTLGTIVKIEHALGHEIIQFPIDYE